MPNILSFNAFALSPINGRPSTDSKIPTNKFCINSFIFLNGAIAKSIIWSFISVNLSVIPFDTSAIFSGIVTVTKLTASVKKPFILVTISVKKPVTFSVISVYFSGTVTVKKLPISVHKFLIGVTILSLKKFVIDVFISSNFCGIVSVKNLPMLVNSSLIFSGNCLKNNLISVTISDSIPKAANAFSNKLKIASPIYDTN